MNISVVFDDGICYCPGQIAGVRIVPVFGVSWFERDQAPGTHSWVGGAFCFIHSTEVNDGNEAFRWQPAI